MQLGCRATKARFVQGFSEILLTWNKSKLCPKVGFIAHPTWQLGDVGGDAPGFICLSRRASAGLVLEIDVRERLPAGVADDEAGVVRLGCSSVDKCSEVFPGFS